MCVGRAVVESSTSSDPSSAWRLKSLCIPGAICNDICSDDEEKMGKNLIDLHFSPLGFSEKDERAQLPMTSFFISLFFGSLIF